MIKITIISVGSIKEKYFIDAIKEYEKRLGKYAEISLVTVADEPIYPNTSNAQIKDKEGERILKVLDKKNYKIVLDLKGISLSSVELSEKIKDICSFNSSSITFIIGGSLGLSNSVLETADYHLCFSKMTFPHQLMKVILLEQIYRAFKIINNETYHK